MRKIESQMLDAIQSQVEFKKDNTCVEWLPLTGQVSIMDCDLVARVYLHGNLIAQFNRALNELTVWDGGWQSVTTKSRLNALLSAFAPDWSVVQRNYEWLLMKRAGLDRHEIQMPFKGGETFRAGKWIKAR